MAFSLKIKLNHAKFLPNFKNYCPIHVGFVLILLFSRESGSVSNVKKASAVVKKFVTSTPTPSSLVFPTPTTTTTTPTPTPTPAPWAKLTTDPDWIAASLERHNYLRSLHGSQPLTLNTTLCEISQAWANYMLARSLYNIHAKEDVTERKFFFDHNYVSNKKHRIGENLYFATHSKGVRYNGSIAVTLWYNEIQDYDFTFAKVKTTSKPNSMIGHFTQLVWNATTQMGTAFAMGELPTGQLATFIAANYAPSGNVRWLSAQHFPEKLYIENVVPPISDAENEIEDVSKIIRDKIKYWEIPTNGTTTPQFWIDQAVEKHNEFRIHHEFPLLMESPELSAIAQSWANTLVLQGIEQFNARWSIDGHYGFRNFGATEKAVFGQNVLYFIEDGESVGIVNPEQLVTLWYQQHKYYDFKLGRPDVNKSATAKTADFEQIMWKPTTHVGIAFASGEAENGQSITFVVAFYHPGGPLRASVSEKLENLPKSGSDPALSTSNATCLIFLLIYCILVGN